MQFQTLQVATISRGQGRLRFNSQTRRPLPIAMSLPSFVGIRKIEIEKSAKMWFQTPEMAAIPKGQGLLRSNSRARCKLPLRMSLQCFVGITKIDLDKSAKMWFQTLKMATISDVKVLWGQFAKKVHLTHSHVSTKFHWNNQNRLEEKYKYVIL